MEPAALDVDVKTEKPAVKKGPPIRDIKAKARAALYTEDHFYKTVIACFFPILLFCFAFVLIDAAAFVSELLSDALPEAVCDGLFISAAVIFGVIFSFLIFAAIAGVHGFAAGLLTHDGRTTTMPDTADLKKVFSPLSHRQKAKETASAFLRFLLSMIPGAVPLLLFVFLGRRFLFPEGGVPFVVITAALSAILFLCAMLLLCDMAAVPYLSEDGITDLRQRMRVSRRIMKRYRPEALRLLLSFVPLMVLSALTLGILLLFYVLPYVAISYAKLAETAYLKYKENI